MSETYGDELGEDERTNPNLALPEEAAGAARPSTIPPLRAPAGPPPRPALPARSLPSRPTPSATPALVSGPRASAPARPLRPSALPPPPSPPPLPARPASVRPPSLPPSSLPKPSDPPPADGGVVLRQRIVLLENALELARGTIDEQRGTIEALGTRLDALTARFAEVAEREARREAQVRELEKRAEELEERAQVDGRLDALEARLGELADTLTGSALADRLADALTPRFDGGGSPELSRRLLNLEERLRTLEQGSAEARLRMRLDRHGHRLDELEQRVPAVERRAATTAETVSGALAQQARHEERIARLESLFEELTEEVREEREALDLAGLRARLDDVETLVLQAGTEEERLKKALTEQEQTLAALRETVEQVERASLAPPPSSAPVGDDLTQIKGIGPKYARLLRELGVTTYAALAAWTDDDVERAAAHLGIPATRVRKAGWVEAAARLVDG